MPIWTILTPAGLRMLETKGGGPMDPTAKSHIYDYFQAMHFFLFLTLQKIINAEKIGFYLKYFLRNDF